MKKVLFAIEYLAIKPRALLLLCLLPAGATAQDATPCRFVPGEGPEMVVIDAGTFTMGSPESEAGRESDEGPQLSVDAVTPFALGRCEVTVAEFAYFVEQTGHVTKAETTGGCFARSETAGDWRQNAGRHWRDPGFAQADASPVACVSWNDANAYADWLSAETGLHYRLPTEAEWEYAARAGTTTRYSWGDDIDCTRARYGFVDDECGKQPSTDPVASYAPNPFGLFDMHGNVWEWTLDCWHENSAGAPADGSAWTDTDGGDCSRRVTRGGGWSSPEDNLRSANRNWNTVGEAFGKLGFRLARDL